MKKYNIINKNSISSDYLKQDNRKKFSRKFDQIYKNILKTLDKKKNSLHVLSERFNFNLKDLKKFKKFKTIVIIGMGGSILGSEAIFNFLSDKIKKEVYFLDDIDEIKILKLKKKIFMNRSLFLVISKSGNTIETLVNFLSLGVIKKNSKNIILIS